MTNFTKEETILLIDIWEQLPCLYDTKHLLYTNKHARTDALIKIVNEMGLKFTKEEVKSKLSTLRSNYNHGTKKIKDSIRSGVGTENVYSPTVFWFEQLKFLEQHIKSRPGKSNIPGRSQKVSEEVYDLDSPPCTLNFSNPGSESIDVSSLDELIEEDSQISPNKKRRVNETDPLLQQASKMMESLNKNLLDKNNVTPNENDIFGKIVTVKLEKIAKLDFDVTLEAQQQIMEVLFVMERKALAKV